MTQINHKKNKKINTRKITRLVIGSFMVAFYFGLAYVLFTNRLFDSVSVLTSRIVGGVLIVYGIFRCYRLAKGLDYTFIYREDDDE